MSPANADACLTHLAEYGYRFIVESRDIIAHLGAASSLSQPTAGRRAIA
jgi:hypothetical protein